MVHMLPFEYCCLHNIVVKSDFEGQFTHFAKMTLSDICDATGLEPEQAKRAANRLYGEPVLWLGSEEQKKRFLPRLATGELIGCFGLTEPNHGSDPGSMITRAKSVPGGFSLSGSKIWISNAPIADLFVIWAKNDDASIFGLWNLRIAKGFTCRQIQGKFWDVFVFQERRIRINIALSR